jgi:uncharacterized membrane protein
MSAGMSLFLIAVGGVLLLAVHVGSTFGINLHVVGIIVLVVGVLGLLLPAGARGDPRPDRLRRWINPSGIDDPTVHSAQSAAEADVRQIREDERLFDPHGPGMQHDEL